MTNEQMAERLEAQAKVNQDQANALAATGRDEAAVIYQQQAEICLAGSEALRKLDTPDPRAQLAALPEPEQPWTPRERRLREALVEAKCYIAMYRDEYLSMHGHISESDKHTIEEDLSLCDAAIADTPPPDPRDETLEAAAQWLEAAANRCESILETSPEYHLVDDIVNYRKAAAIARARGGK